MPRGLHLVFFGFWICSQIFAAGDGQSPENVARKFIRISINVEFRADEPLSLPGNPTGSTAVSRGATKYILVVVPMASTKTSSTQSREIEVDERTFVKARIGRPYEAVGGRNRAEQLAATPKAAPSH